MEKYLIEQYDVFEDEKYLTSEKEIIDYFKDVGRDYFDCGQGYYQDEVDLICKIGNKFYSVTIQAEIMSAKQDVGDRLYWVDYITDVTYKEIDKPQPKSKQQIQYNMTLTVDQKTKLEAFMKENNIEFTN